MPPCTLYNLFLSGNAQQEAASSESEMTIAVDLSLFADVYESSILQLDQLTPHQEEKMGDALRLLRGDETHIVHLTAPAGAGKTFVAQQIVLDLLKDLSRDGIILFSARTVPLCLFFVKWLVKRCLNSRMALHDRLAIIVPEEGMRAKLQEKLKARLVAAFPSRSFELVDAQRASRTYKKGVGSSEWLVLDTIENMDGLERLIVIAVGLDSSIPENAEAAAEGDVLRTRSTMQTRSHLYRALTRAHLLVCVVNDTPLGLPPQTPAPPRPRCQTSVYTPA